MAAKTQKKLKTLAHIQLQQGFLFEQLKVLQKVFFIQDLGTKFVRNLDFLTQTRCRIFLAKIVEFTCFQAKF